MIFMTLMSPLIQHTVLKQTNDVMLLNEQALKFNHVDSHVWKMRAEIEIFGG